MSSGGGTDASDGDAIKVFIRIRPPDSYDVDIGQHRSIVVDPSEKTLIVQSKPEKVFTFDRIIKEDATQDGIFSLVGKKIIDSCVSGYNGTIFAYGQTGSGKTYTMLGPSEDAENFQHELRGIVPRSFEYLFHVTKREQELDGKTKEFLMKCSFLEIYNEHAFDLLEPSTVGLQLRESMKRGIYVDGLTEVTVTSPSEAYQVLSSGWRNRRVASTSMNRESSRSHAVFSVIIESKENKQGLQNVKTSQLNLVDLAGSERQKDTNAVGQRLREASNINNSLSTLGNVIMSLVSMANGKARYIPYRDSKLTFLLRDSLGGNAKTHLISCVHPSSRFFGETLSTLQFAKRAKMIKNKARVNLDTQGDISMMQAEIRRLKELLRQFQSGITESSVAQQSASGETQVAVPTVSDNSEWQNKFIHAMVFREKSEADKQVLQENISKLEDLLNKKDRYLQSSKMITKFRENRISQLEKAAKTNGMALDTEDMVRDLKAEVKRLNEMLEHNPKMAKYVMEIQHLKSELKQISKKGQEKVMADLNRLEELEICYKKLLLEKNKGTDEEIEMVLSPSHTPQSGEHLSTATVEKYKAQIANLNTEISSLKQTLTEQKEKSEKKEMEIESELTSHKQAVKELTTLLEAHQLKSKLERNVHLKMVKNIATPQRTYNLRNRVIHVSDSPGSTPLDDSIPFEDEAGIIDEARPDEMVEEAHEALLEEIKQLQESNNSLTQRLEEYESDAVRLKQHISKIDHQNAQLQNIIGQERNERGTREEQLTAFKGRTESAEKDKQLLETEIRDLKILLTSADRELKLSKEKFKISEETFEKSIGSLETKLMQISNEFSIQTKEYETVCEERDSLKESKYVIEETNRFFENVIKETEDSLHQQNLKLQETTKELENTKEQLAIEKRNIEDLHSQFSKEGAAQEETLLELMKERDLLQSELTFETNKTEEHLKTITGLESKKERLQRQVEEDQEVMASYMLKNQELREQLSTLTGQLEDVTQQCKALKDNLEELTAELEKKNLAVQELKEQLVKQTSAHDVEMSMMTEEIEYLTQNYNKGTEEFHRLQEVNQTEIQSLNEEIKNLKTEAGEKEAHYKKVLCEKEDQLKETERRVLTEELQAYNEEIITLQNANSSLNNIIDEYEKSHKQKNNEINSLKEKLVESSSYQTELEKVQESYKLLEYEKEKEKLSLEESLTEMKQKMQEFNMLQEELFAAKKQHDLTKAVRCSLELQLGELVKQREMEEDTRKTLQEDIDRLKDLAKKYYDEKEDMFVRIQLMDEERMRYYKEREEQYAKIEKLENDNAQLSGHQNPKQRIHYTQSLKEENSYLREQLQIKQKQYNELRLEVCTNSLKKQSDTPLKENVHPNF